MTTSPFKAYDIRGRIGDTLTEEIAYRLGRAIAADPAAGPVVTGRDIRASSPALQAALIDGVTAGGLDAIDIGLCGTEEVYFATDHLAAQMGVMITASHNPMDQNGMKLVGPGARPLAPATFRALEARTLAGPPGPAHAARGQCRAAQTRPAYVDRVLSFVDPARLPPLRLLANAGNGCAGPTFDALLEALGDRGVPLDVVRLHHDPDSRFPNGIPNPLLPANQPATGRAVTAAGADLGIAWDGDFDRCFFFDQDGVFVPGEYIVAVMAEAMLARSPGATIVHDPRVVWNTRTTVAAAGGQAHAAPTGHALQKAAMRATGAVYGGEISAHHYFRDFMYCDSGQIPWLLLLATLGESGTSLRARVADMRRAFPSSGELNFHVGDANRIISGIEAAFSPRALDVDHLDGLSMTFAETRFNLRRSNTEDLLRLNVEARGDPAHLARMVEDLTARITAGG